MAFNLQESWEQDRAFFILLGGGLGLLILAQLVIHSMYREPAHNAQLELQKLQKQMAQPNENTENLRVLEVNNQQLTQQLQALEKKISFAWNPELLLTDGQASPENQYFTITSRVQNSLLREAMQHSMQISAELGLPRTSPSGREEIARYLRGLNLVQHLLSLAMDHGIETIEAIRIIPGSSRSALRSKDSAMQLEEIGVNLKFSAPETKIMNFLRATQHAATPLLIDKAHLSASARENNLFCEVQFLATKILGITQEETHQ